MERARARGRWGRPLTSPPPPPPVLSTADWSWDSHAFALLQRCYPSAAPALDGLFRVARTFTYNSFGDSAQVVNTEPIRTGLWRYCQRLYGVEDADYNYATINLVLPRPLKAFVKRVVCAPESLSPDDFHAFSSALTHSERVHVVLICVEARRQAALLWGLRAVAGTLGAP